LAQVAEEKLEEHHRLNCPELRRLESRQMQRVVQEEWKAQQERREQVLMASFSSVSRGCLANADSFVNEH